jgi:hypothetical protein
MCGRHKLPLYDALCVFVGSRIEDNPHPLLDGKKQDCV